MGVPGRSVTTAEDFSAARTDSVREPGPRLIEVVM
jgi:acetolactate synthase-1/2/3 large subunit